MPSILKAAVLALGALCASSPAWAIDPFFPEFGNNGIDVQNYDLDLDVAMPSSKLKAKATLDIVATAPLTAFKLDLHGLKVSEIRVNGIPATFLQRDDKLKITPRTPIAKGDVFKTVIAYGGVPTPIQDPTAPTDPTLLLGWFTYAGAAYALSEPVGASTFYPANDEPTDKATFRIVVTVPSDYTAVANGVLKSTIVDGAKKRFAWIMRQPMTTWLATVHVNKFNLTQLTSTNGKPIRIYSTPSTSAADVKNYSLARNMISFFEPLVGPYPFDGYGTVTVDDPALYYALETQGVSTFPTGFAVESVVAHELMHQWFGDSVSVGAWADLWIAEGTATYFEVLWPNRNSPKGFDDAMLEMYDYAVAQKLGPAVVDKGEDIFSDRTYVRGSLALYALRLKVGDATFYKILKSFQAKYRSGNTNTHAFIVNAVEVSKDPQVQDLLNAWLYEQPIPALPASGAGARAFAAKKNGTVAKPDIFGLRCGRGSHRGAPTTCGESASAAPAAN